MRAPPKSLQPLLIASSVQRIIYFLVTFDLRHLIWQDSGVTMRCAVGDYTHSEAFRLETRLVYFVLLILSTFVRLQKCQSWLEPGAMLHMKGVCEGGNLILIQITCFNFVQSKDSRWRYEFVKRKEHQAEM